jgi:hypothetical protein
MRNKLTCENQVALLDFVIQEVFQVPDHLKIDAMLL